MYYHNFLVILATFNEYHWSFFTSGAQISYKTNTVGRSVKIKLMLNTDASIIQGKRQFTVLHQCHIKCHQLYANLPFP